MKTPRLRLLVLASVLFSASPGRADELILNSGKILHGRITSEDEDSYTLKVRSNMSLNVAKRDVARIERDPPPETEKPLRPIAKKPKAVAPAAAAPAPKKPVAAPVALAAVKKEEVAPPPPNPPAEPSPVDQLVAPTAGEATTSDETSAPVTVSPELPPVRRTVGAVTLNKSTLKAFYEVKGATFEAAMKFITDPAQGKGFLLRGSRRPSRTQWRLSWYGTTAAGGGAWETLVVNSTITTTLPAWKARRSGDSQKWDAMLKEGDNIENAHVRIIEEALTTFGTEASNLTAPNEQELRIETGKLLSDARARSDKRRKGYDRRRTEMKRVIRKKPLHK